MQDFEYKYTIKNRITGKTLFLEIDDISQIGSLSQDSFFQYIATEAKMKRLGECKLENEDYICIVRFGSVQKVA